MAKAEAKVEAMRIFDEAVKEKHAVWNKLKEQGYKCRCLDGDTPPEIKAIDDECRRKIKELAAQIED